MRGKMYIIRRVIPLLTLCAILNGCNALRASETMDPLRGPDASPLSDPDIAATASIPTIEPLETFAASSSSSAIHASQTPMTTAARPDPTLTPSPTFTPSVVPGMPENCHPFPYDIEGFSQASNGEMLVNAICKGESIEFPSPVGAPVIYDYTPSTGRLAYSRNIERAYDPRTGYSHGAIGDLWVFDFWTGQDERWLDGGVWEIA